MIDRVSFSVPSAGPDSHVTAPRGAYASQSRRSPASLAIAVGLHGAVAALVLLLPGQTFVKDAYKVIWARNIPVTPVPPPPEPKLIEKAKVETPVRTTITDPIIDLDKPADFELPKLPPIIPMDPGEGKTIVEPPLPPPALPKIVDAMPDPRYASQFQPSYPPAKLRLNEEGKVTVRVQIGVDGRVEAVELVSASDNAFWERTRDQAMAKWRFKPATRDGVAVESSRVMTVYFRMTD